MIMKSCMAKRVLAITLSFLLMMSSTGLSAFAGEYTLPEENFLVEEAFSSDALLSLPEVHAEGTIPSLGAEDILVSEDILAAEDFFTPWEEEEPSQGTEPFDVVESSEDMLLLPAPELVEEGDGLLSEEAPGAEAAEEVDPLVLFTSPEDRSLGDTSLEAFAAEDLFSADFVAITGANSATAVPYVEQSYDGSLVVSTVKTVDASPVPSNGTMTSGWYYLGNNVTKNGRIELTGTVHLILGDGYTLDTKGLYVPKGSTLYIYGQTGGTGKIYSHPSDGAAIGGYSGHDNGSIEIHGGIIEAKGGGNCAGIGSNSGQSTEGITIYGGNITSTGGSNGAGIGAGRNSDGAVIRIYGGNITATGKDSSAGIGGGDPDGSRADFSTIEIYGGTITSTGNSKGAGIGGGEYGSASITISGGKVIATGGSTGGAGIGSGADGSGSTILISGGWVEAYAKDSKAFAIGNGKNQKGNTSIINLGDAAAKRLITITAASYGGVATLRQTFYTKIGITDPQTISSNDILSGYLQSMEDATTWRELQDIIDFENTYCNIVLSQDYTAGAEMEALKIPADMYVTIDLNGKTLNRNLGYAANNGSAIINEGNLIIEDSKGGGRITGGWTRGSGGGIYNSGTLTISGGEITGNRAEGWGGGIYMPDGTGAMLHLEGGSITGNTCGKNGGGIHSSASAALKVLGSPVVSGNKRGNADNNINLAAGSVIQVDGALKEGALLHVSRSDGVGTITSGYSRSNNDVAPENYFYPDNTAYYPFLKDNEVFIGAYADHVSYRERGSDGTAVTEKDITLNKVPLVPDDGKMLSGWYYLGKNITVKERIFLTGDTNLILGDGFTLDVKGIYVPQGSTFTIYGQAKDSGKLYSHPDQGGAGIGATRDNHPGGAVVIHGGTIETIGDSHCAGIGSNDGNGTTAPITIYGGNITAKGGSDGAAIGGGRKCDGGNITIYGGTILADNTNCENGAGIGGGDEGKGGTITIHGGKITTYSRDGAGIGGGDDGDGGSITITGGEITCRDKGNAQGARIGGGCDGNGGTITISGGKVYAYGRDGACIGGGEDADGGTITITGGKVYAYSAEGSSGNGAGIGGGNHSGKGGTITIIGGFIHSETFWGAAIGGGRGADSGLFEGPNNSGDGGTIQISGGTVEAICRNSFGIGAGGIAGEFTVNYQDYPKSQGIGSAGSVTIGGDALVMASGRMGGIGGDSGTISITSGTVKTTGYQTDGCGLILLSNKGNINISGGEVTAIGYGNQPAISLENGTVTISGGTVNAQAVYYAIGSRGLELDEVEGNLIVTGSGTVLRAFSEKYAAIDTNKNMDSHCKFGPGITVETYSPDKGDKRGEHEDRPIFYEEAQILVGSAKDGSDARILPAGERKDAYKNKNYKYMLIQPCNHPEETYKASDTGHTKACSYCTTAFREEPHQMANGVCQLCGYHESTVAVVKFKKGAEGAAGEMPPETAPKDGDYTIPACTYAAPQGLFFTHWSMGDTALHPGDVIHISGDITLTAVWGHTHEGIEFIPWTSANSLPGPSEAGKSYYLTSDVTIGGEGWTWEEGTLNLCLAGHTISAKEINVPVISVKGGTLNLFSEGGGTITQFDGREATVFIDEGATCTMDGVTVGNDMEDYFACVQTYGSFAMKDSTIAGRGLGVWVFGDGSITISGDVHILGHTYGDVMFQASDKKIHISGPLSEDARIGVNRFDYGASITEGLSGNGTAENFLCEAGDVVHVHRDGEAHLEKEYVITLKAGEGNGEDITISSAKKENWVGDGDEDEESDSGKFFTSLEDEDCFFIPFNPFTVPEGKIFIGWLVNDGPQRLPQRETLPIGNHTLTAQFAPSRTITWEQLPDFASYMDFLPAASAAGEQVPVILHMNMDAYNAGTRLVAIKVTGEDIDPILITKDLEGNDLRTTTLGIFSPFIPYRIYTAEFIMPDADVTVTAVWETPPSFKTHSLVLSGLIGLNFFMDLPEAEGVDYTGSYVEFSVSGKAGTVSRDDFDPQHKNETGETYGFTCYVTSVQMADEITATFHYGNGKTISQTYSVAQYVKDFEAVRDRFDAATIKAVEAIADYGHFMQIPLSQANGWTIGTDHAEMPGVSIALATEENISTLKAAVADHAFDWDVAASKVSDITFDLTLDSSTTLRVFFTPEEGFAGEFTAYLGNGTENVAVRQADGRYLVTIPDIPAHLLGQKYLIHGEADGEYYVTLSALTYIDAVLGIPQYQGNTDMLSAMYALYQYYQAVMDYRARG